MKRVYSILILLMVTLWACQNKQDNPKSAILQHQENSLKSNTEEDSLRDNTDIVFPEKHFEYAIVYSVPFKERRYFSERIMLTGTCGGPALTDETGKVVYPNILNKKKLSVKDVEKIADILKFSQRKFMEDYACGPEFREMIVYYDKNDKPVEWINICFGCKAICFQPETEKNILLSRRIDYIAIDSLYSLFQQVGVIDKEIRQEEINRIDHSQDPEIHFLHVEPLERNRSSN